MTSHPDAPALPAPRASVQAMATSMVEARRDFHANAELSTEEHRTQSAIIDRLRTLGLEDVRGIADTGVTGLIRGGPGPNLMWRADIDGLPLLEETGLPFASTARAMHACGHDGHTAIALALAEVVQASREQLSGTLRFAFQPAEEHVGGARRMIDEGIMRSPRVDRVFGLHIWASAALGDVLVGPGAIFAAATHFRIIIRGRGGHAAAPHQTIDPILVASHAVVALQTVVSRSVDPSDTAVLSVGRIEGGVRGNIIPNEVMMSGTIRTYDERVLARVLRRVEELLAGVTAAWGARYQFDHSTLGACVNDDGCAELVRGVAAEFLGEDHVRSGRATGADDMCLFLEAAPGAYFLLGAARRDTEYVYPHHHPRFDFDETCMPLGLELAVRIIERASGSRIA